MTSGRLTSSALLLRQYSYFCSSRSKASKTEYLLRQYSYFCSRRKASKTEYLLRFQVQCVRNGRCDYEACVCGQVVRCRRRERAGVVVVAHARVAAELGLELRCVAYMRDAPESEAGTQFYLLYFCYKSTNTDAACGMHPRAVIAVRLLQSGGSENASFGEVRHDMLRYVRYVAPAEAFGGGNWQ